MLERIVETFHGFKADAVREERFLGSVEVRILRILLEHHHVKVQRFGPDSELDQAVAAPAELLPHEFERLGVLVIKVPVFYGLRLIEHEFHEFERPFDDRMHELIHAAVPVVMKLAGEKRPGVGVEILPDQRGGGLPGTPRGEEIFPETDFRAKRRHHGFDGVHQIDERLKLVEAAFFRCSA